MAEAVPQIKMMPAATAARIVPFQRQSQDNVGSFIAMVVLAFQV